MSNFIEYQPAISLRTAILGEPRPRKPQFLPAVRRRKLARCDRILLCRLPAQTMRTVPILCALLSVGCDSLREEVPGLFAVAPRVATAVATAPNRPNQLPQLARQIESKFKPPAMPALGAHPICSPSTALDSAEPEALRLVLVSVDARTQTKNLIPRRVSERLESGELTLLGSLLETDENAPAARRDVPASASSLTLKDLRQIERQRYLGVFYVTDYHGPALILRVGKIRREWYAGSLVAKFILFDSERQLAVCGADLHVTNDTESAPIRSRLQSETRSRLERELGDALRVAAQQATRGLRVRLTWPDTGLK